MTDSPSPTPPAGHDVVVVGASLGGVDALKTLAGGLPPDLPAAVVVVQHTAASSPGALGEVLDRAGPLPARLAEDGDPLRPGHVLVAPPDRHVLVTDGPGGLRLRLSRGPRENRTRPAVDPLFRSAAVAARSRAVGVVLTGLLDDGAAGLAAVARCGGLALVQDPAGAAYGEMPRSALAAVPDARTAPLAEIGPLLGRLAGIPAGPAPPVLRELQIEAHLTLHGMDDIDAMDEIGDRTPMTCPDCGGVLWGLGDGAPPRFRCHTGHAYTEASLTEAQTEATEAALYVALRTVEERVRLLRRMAREERRHGAPAAGDGGSDYGARAAELERSAGLVRDLLVRTKGRPGTDGPGPSHGLEA